MSTFHSLKMYSNLIGRVLDNLHFICFCQFDCLDVPLISLLKFLSNVFKDNQEDFSAKGMFH